MQTLAFFVIRIDYINRFICVNVIEFASIVRMFE